MPVPSIALPLLLGLSLLLNACTTRPPDRPPLTVSRHITEVRPKGCQEENCPLVNLDLEQFPDEPALNRLVDQRLRLMTRYDPADPVPASLAVYEQGFLASARPGWGSWLQAKLVDWPHDLLVVELSSYLFEGGAHGLPGRGFINYSRHQQRALTLQDLLAPGKEGAFWRVVQQAHHDWVSSHHGEERVSFLQQWPFQRTANIALRRTGVELKYDVYSIAPYADGHPDLMIPYDQLQGIIRPEYSD